MFSTRTACVRRYRLFQLATKSSLPTIDGSGTGYVSGPLYQGRARPWLFTKEFRRSNNKTHDAAQPVFSFPADPNLAQVIVDAWLNTNFPWTPSGGGAVQNVPLRDALLDRNNKGNPTKKAFEVATQRIRQALNVDLKRAVVITEDEHDNDYFLDEDEVVFVLPDLGRLSPTPNPGNPSANLLATAKLLMACTPNGI